MDEFFSFAEHLFKGGPEAIIALLILIIAALFIEIRRLRTEIKSREEKLDKIVDDYHKGNLTIAEAMNSLKFVLAEIKGKLS
jgi:predicted Holliday junction resolvase-like endonuclease